MTLQETYRRLDDVRDEYHGARFALRLALRGYEDGPIAREVNHREQEQVTLHHLESCVKNLQITYLVRLFAEFEGILREYWLNGRRRATKPPMVDLMNSVAAYCFMNDDNVRDAHEVRDYRNDVVHEHHQDPRFDFQTCRSRLARFVRWLSQKW